MIWRLFGHEFFFFAEERQWNKLLSYIKYYFVKNIPSRIGTALLLVSLVCSLHISNKRRTSDKVRKSSFGLLLILYMSSIMAFMGVPDMMGYGVEPLGLSYYLTEHGFHETHIILSIVKVIAFIPIGYLVRRCLKSSNRRWLLIIGYSILIEVLQVVCSIGFFAVQDIVAYIVGAAIGLNWKKHSDCLKNN